MSWLFAVIAAIAALKMLLDTFDESDRTILVLSIASGCAVILRLTGY